MKTKDTEDSKDVGSKEFNKLLKKVEDKMNSKRTKREQYAFLYAILKMSSNKSEYQSTGLGITSTKEYKRDKQLLEDFFNFLKEGYKDADGDGDKDKIEILTGLFKSLDMPYEEINNHYKIDESDLKNLMRFLLNDQDYLNWKKIYKKNKSNMKSR